MATKSPRANATANAAVETLATQVSSKTVTITPPKFQVAQFRITAAEGAPLVLHRFSAKTKAEMQQKMETGKAASSKKNRPAHDFEVACNDARYISPEGWDGFHAASVRNAVISACRLCGFKMTLAKLSVFVIADGYDEKEPQIPLIRIIGKHTKQIDMARVETGQPYVVARPAYHNWQADVRIRWDADQFTVEDVTNLLSRVGLQVGIGEGRPDSKNSAGMGWGLFEVTKVHMLKAG